VNPLSFFLLVLVGLAGQPVRNQGAPECRSLDTPKRLPAVAELIDYATLASRLAAAPLDRSPGIQLGVAFPDPAGPPQAWVIDSGVNPDVYPRLAGLVQAALRADGAPPGTTLRIQVRATDPVGMEIQRSMLCSPVPLDAISPTQPAVQVVSGGRPVPDQRWKAVIRQRIGADGVVLEARLQPGSGKPELDRLALLPVYARRWRPATLDGRPVEVWLVKDRVDLARP
jgi:hypothetical protein